MRLQMLTIQEFELKEIDVKKLYLSLLILLSGCASDLPTYVQDLKSPFDGDRELSVSPGFVRENNGALAGAPFNLGAAWLEKRPEEIQIEAEVTGEIINLSRVDGLQFNIDGEKVSLSSPSALTTHKVDKYLSKSSRIYIADIELLDKLLGGSEVKVKLVGDGGYRVGDFSVDGLHTAKSGFLKLQEALNKARE